jgi:hypothetical protein
MNRRLLRCHGFFKVSDIFRSSATLSTFGKGGAKVRAKHYPPLEKVEPKTTKKQRKTNKNKEKQIKTNKNKDKLIKFIGKPWYYHIIVTIYIIWVKSLKR